MALIVESDPHGRASLHATAVAMDSAALVLVGESGSGKSRVAAQMLALGAGLIVDDLVVLSHEAGQTFASAPEGVEVRIELRGIGILSIADPAPPSPVRGVCILKADQEIERLPVPETALLLGQECPLTIQPFAEDLGARLLLWLGSCRQVLR